MDGVGVLYATVLGIATPILAARLLLRNLRWQRKAFEACILLACCLGFKHFASQSGAGDGPFDPYSILEVNPSSNATTIRAAYRKLSLRNHPDKRPGDKLAAARFAEISKAYQTLTDATLFQNWKEFGHPDGKRPYSVDVVLPLWLSPPKDAGPLVASAYVFSYLGTFCLAVWLASLWLRPAASKKAYRLGAGDYMALAQGLGALKSEADVFSLFAAMPGLCTDVRVTVSTALAEDGTAAAMGRALADVDLALSAAAARTAPAEPATAEDEAEGRQQQQQEQQQEGGGASAAVVVAKRKGKKRRAAGASSQEKAPPPSAGQDEGGAEGAEWGIAAHNRAVLLGLLHGSRLEGWPARRSPGLRAEEAFLSAACEALLDAMMHVSKDRSDANGVELAVSSKAMLRRRLWSTSDSEALAAQERDMARLNVFVPRVEVTVEGIETPDEPQIAVGDLASATLHITRHHAIDYAAAHPKLPVEGSPVERGEPWWVVVSRVQPKGGRQLLAVAPVLVEDMEEEVSATDVRFRVPPPTGKAKLHVSLRSPVFAGCSAVFVSRPYDVVVPDDDEDRGEDAGDE